MTHTIWKFPVFAQERQTLSMPKDAIVRSVQIQGPQGVQLWAEIPDDTAETEERTVLLVGTGNEIPADAKTFIDTVQVGPYVFHAYLAD